MWKLKDKQIIIILLFLFISCTQKKIKEVNVSGKDLYGEVDNYLKLSDSKELQIEKERWTSRLTKTIKNHKLLTTTIVAFFMFSTLNIIMIYSFMKILQNI